jgi:hypothetical protein
MTGVTAARTPQDIDDFVNAKTKQHMAKDFLTGLQVI